jgi:hypothetical protein
VNDLAQVIRSTGMCLPKPAEGLDILSFLPLHPRKADNTIHKYTNYQLKDRQMAKVEALLNPYIHIVERMELLEMQAVLYQGQ